MKPYHLLIKARRDAKVQNFARNIGILEVDYEPLAHAIEYNLIIVLTFQLPVLLHPWGHMLVILLRNI